jgi:hypothetical protein
VKKAFMISSLSVWTLALLIGVVFAVVGQVTGVQQLPGENYQLRTERDSLKETIATDKETIATERDKHAGDIENYTVAIDRWEFQNIKMVESLRLDTAKGASTSVIPREE